MRRVGGLAPTSSSTLTISTLLPLLPGRCCKRSCLRCRLHRQTTRCTTSGWMSLLPSVSLLVAMSLRRASCVRRSPRASCNSRRPPSCLERRAAAGASGQCTLAVGRCTSLRDANAGRFAIRRAGGSAAAYCRAAGIPSFTYGCGVCGVADTSLRDMRDSIARPASPATYRRAEGPVQFPIAGA